jgi:predicted DNA repair protein MutK
MAGGLIALLDDVAALAKLAAASLDDVGAAAARAGTKAAGVVIDDTAVTPRYVIGLSPARELPIIGKIALGSLRNKLLFLLPAALLLEWLAPWAVTPLLMLGGAYLCFEGAEKVIEAVTGHGHAEEEVASTDPKVLEDRQVSGAIRTDFILSAEIMAIALAEVSNVPLLTQAITLALVALAITAGVYGVVALIVKADDLGLYLAKRGGALAGIGRGLVKGVPHVMRALSVIGTAAMIWVGGQILVHGMAQLGFVAPEHVIDGWAAAARQAVPVAPGVVAWLTKTVADGILGLIVGGAIAAVVHAIGKARGKA